MRTEFFQLCEDLWRNWLTGELVVPDSVRKRFDLDAAPEPYLYFDVGSNPLAVMTTNPGASMPHQRKSVIVSGAGPVRADQKYEGAARDFAEFYSEHLRGSARTRIHAMLRLAELAGYDGVVQVESCPFHSPLLSTKRKGELVQLFEADGLLQEYAASLQRYLAERPVVVVSAYSSRGNLAKGAVTLSSWLAWQAEFIGFDVAQAGVVELVSKAGRATCSALVGVQNAMPRALVLMMGGNYLPGDAGISRLAAAIGSGGAPNHPPA